MPMTHDAPQQVLGVYFWVLPAVSAMGVLVLLIIAAWSVRNDDDEE